MRRFTVMGFTEAELGFVVAAAFAGMAVMSAPDAAKRIDPRTQAERTHSQVDSLRHALDSVKARFAAYRDSARMRSHKTPRCTERGEPPGPVADLSLLGSDAYGYQGERLTFDELKSRLSGPIERSESLNCHYVVRTHAVSGVDGPATMTAAWRLWSVFDVDLQNR
jgi:hypothetical protein